MTYRMTGEDLSKPKVARITPMNLSDLPTVLDTGQAANVLRMSVEAVRRETKAGHLRRLTYARNYLFSAREIERFLDEYSGELPGDSEEAS